MKRTIARPSAWMAGLVFATASFAIPMGASATTLEISITNTQSTGGLFLTPVFTAIHDGSLDFFTPGTAASAELESLAEDGMTAGVQGLADAAGAVSGVAVGTSVAPPPLNPGETATLRLDVADPTTNRFLSFLSMVIPSNDAFIGNGNPLAYELFDMAGNFTGIGPISVLGGQVWDAGTEVNDGQGAAFNAAGGTSTDEGGTVALFGDLSPLLFQTTAAGPEITSVPGTGDVLAVINVAAVPLPAGGVLLLAALGAGAGLARRRAV